MPLYEYQCDACGKRFEKIQKFSDPPPASCTHCGKGPVQRLMSSPAIQFKGTGWYITDYAQKGKSKDASTSGGGSEGKKSDASTADSGAKSESATKSDSGTPASTPTPSKTES